MQIPPARSALRSCCYPNWFFNFMQFFYRPIIKLAMLGIVVALSIGTVAHAESGSAGGTIGNVEKSPSGTRSAPATESEKPAPRIRPAQRPHPSQPADPKPYEPMGSGIKSDGRCICKDHCNEFAARGQSTPAQTRQCISNCQQTYAGCNRGSLR